jgi:hypothetical protein
MSILIKRVAEFRGVHQGEKIIVCGCGTSLLNFAPVASNWTTIGVNDVPALFEPTYLLVTDHPERFNSSRCSLINKSKTKYFFTCAKGWRHPRTVHFDLGTKDIKNLDDPQKIDHFVHSPFVAVGLAYKMGAKRIGLIGVDFTDGHFYNPGDGAHPVIKVNYLRQVNKAYHSMIHQLKNRGVSLHNLSQSSLVEVPKITMEEFEKL